jgi:eukaryotic-like serine/threonine-protein kinase
LTFEQNRGQDKLKKCPACNREFVGSMVVCPQDSTLLIPVKKDALLGTKVAEKYEVLSEVGHGGMSIVYKARHELMDRIVAIKMLQAALVNDQTSIKRFQQEAQAASCLTHPNVIAVHDYGLAPSGQPYLVMDFLQGESLADVIKRDNHVEGVRAANIFIQACDALEHAHQKGVLHRDLKSGNIMLTEFEGHQDVVKVVDFGIAKLMPNSGKQIQNLTQTGEIFGSPIYMSPEQCLGQQLDSRSDIYSMGTMLYEALTGLPPLMGDTIIDTMQMHVSTKPQPFTAVRPDLKIPPELERICFRAVEKKQDDRFPSMAIFREALEKALEKIVSDNGLEPPRSRFGPRGTKQNMTPSQRSSRTNAKPVQEESLFGEHESDDSQRPGRVTIPSVPPRPISRPAPGAVSRRMTSGFDAPSQVPARRTREDFELPPDADRPARSKTLRPSETGGADMKKPIQPPSGTANSKTGLIVMIVLLAVGAILVICYFVFSAIPHESP